MYAEELRFERGQAEVDVTMGDACMEGANAAEFQFGVRQLC